MAQRGRRRQVQREVWRYQAVHRLTGEIYELPDSDERQPKIDRDHVLLFQAAILRVAAEDRLSRDAWRVLACLLSLLQWDNWLVVPQSLLMARLQMHQPNVSRALAELVALGILRRATAPPAPRSTFRLNSDYAYKGQRNGWHKRQHEEAHGIAEEPTPYGRD